MVASLFTSESNACLIVEMDDDHKCTCSPNITIKLPPCRHWSYVTDLGATTTWERFDPQWHDVGVLELDGPPVNAMNDRTSMAHPWASGATAFLTKTALGVTATTPGYATWDAFPAMMGPPSAGRLLWVEGTVPVASLDVTNGRVNAVAEVASSIGFCMNISAGTCHAFAPRGTTGRVGIPLLSSGLQRVCLNAIPGQTGCDNTEEALVLWRNISGGGTRQDNACSRNVTMSIGDRHFILGNLTGPANYHFGFEYFHPTTEHSLPVLPSTSKRLLPPFR